MFGFQIEDSSRSVNIESAFIVFLVFAQFLGLYWSMRVIVIAYAFGIAHIYRLFGFEQVFGCVSVVEEELLVFEHEISTLPICHAHVGGGCLLEDPALLVIVAPRVSRWFYTDVVRHRSPSLERRCRLLDFRLWSSCRLSARCLWGSDGSRLAGDSLSAAEWCWLGNK